MTTPRNEELKEEYSTANFIRTYMNDHNGGTPRWLRSIFFDEREKIEKILEYMKGMETERTALIEEIVKLSDEIEMSQPDGGLEEWKAFKHFRNKLRDMKSHLESDNHTKQ